jgi:uncharacterized SAM-binding protein YcdF (DUF218 family)
VDAIIVFGAAQYNGLPSPVFKARLDHAFDLEERGLAPIIVTTGGKGRDAHFTEAGVGRDYLIQKGASARRVLSTPYGESTFESIRYVARLLRKLRAQRCIAVSDGFHLYRIKRMLAAQGITAYGSPAPSSPIEVDPFQRVFHSLREMLVSTLWYLGIHG